MAGNASRLRRQHKRKMERDKERKALGSHEMEGRYPRNSKGFYIWAETATKFSYRRSPWLGPFDHIRVVSEFAFASNAGPHHESIVAWYDGGVHRWIINHKNADPDGYMEVLFSDHEPPRPQEETLPVITDGNEASTADGPQVQEPPPV